MGVRRGPPPIPHVRRPRYPGAGPPRAAGRGRAQVPDRGSRGTLTPSAPADTATRCRPRLCGAAAPRLRGPLRGPLGTTFALHAGDELVDALVDGLERALAQDGALRLVVELEVHPVDGEVAALLLGAADELTAQPRPGRLRRHVLRLEDPRLVGHPVDLAVALEQVVEPAPAADVVIGEVHLGDAGVRERKVALGAVALDEAELGGPVDLAVDEAEVLGVDRLEHPAPELEHLPVHRAEALPVDVLRGARVVLGLDLQRRHLPAVGEPDLAPSGHVVADLADGADRILQRHVLDRDTGLDHPQHQVGHGDLEQRRRLVHVRVADDDVQPPVALGVGVRLVAGVDDRPRAGGGAGDALPDVLGALADAVDGPARRLQYLAGADDDLPADQERDEDVGQAAELAVPPDTVVLVAAVAVAGGVGVVLEQVDVAGDPLFGQALLGVDEQALEDPLPRLVVNDELGEVVALGGRVLGVAAHVEVEPRAVAEEDVGAAPPRDHAAEQVSGDLVRGEPALAAKGARDAVLGLDAEDPSVHGPSVGAGGDRSAVSTRLAAHQRPKRRR